MAARGPCGCRFGLGFFEPCNWHKDKINPIKLPKMYRRRDLQPLLERVVDLQFMVEELKNKIEEAND